MKKTLSVLLTLVLVVGTVAAAAPTFSGTFSYGYQFNFDGSIESGSYLGDGDGNRASYLYLKTSTDYADIDFRLLDTADKIVRGDIGATATVKFAPVIADLFECEVPVSLDLMVGNQAFSAKDTWAYAASGSSDDEIEMDNNRVFAPIGLSVGYEDYVTFNVYANFADKVAAGPESGNDKTVILEALIQPVEGVRAQAAWLIGKDSKDRGDLQFAALVDVGTLADLDFSLGISGFYKGYTEDMEGYSLAKAALTGGWKGLNAYVEYVYSTTGDSNFYDDGYKGSSLFVGASYDFDTKVPFSISGSLDFVTLDTDAKVGGELAADTTIGGMGFQAKFGIDDFSNSDTGYFRLASLISF